MPNILGRLYSIGYTALRARQTEMDTTSNNLANLNTPGFKEARSTFQAALGLLAQQIERRGVDLDTTTADFAQGSIETTGQAWDLAIDGPGFFTLALPDGRTGYTRLGMFHVDPTGRLANQQGFLLQPGITVPPETDGITVDAGGRVTATVGGQPRVLGRLQIARFANPEGLLDQGDSIYMPSAASGQATLGAPTENGMGQILAGAIESSNVNTSQQMINILHTQRAYSLTLRALQVSDQMASLTNQLQG